MSIEKRVNKLENESGGGGDGAPGFIYVSWGSDGSIPDDAVLKLDNGLLMSWAEYKKRYGDNAGKIINFRWVEWEEDEDISLE